MSPYLEFLISLDAHASPLTDAHTGTHGAQTIRIVCRGIFGAKLSGGEISATDGWTFFSIAAHCSLSQRTFFFQKLTDHRESRHSIISPSGVPPS